MNLIKAVAENDLPEIAMCILHGSDINQAEDWANVTPLHHAVSNNSLATILLLLSAGANPLIPERIQGQNPLEMANLLQRYKLSEAMSWFLKNRGC